MANALIPLTCCYHCAVHKSSGRWQPFGTPSHSQAGVTGRRRRRLAAEAEGGSATAVQPSTAGRVGCFPPFTKWQDFEVWLAISDAGAPLSFIRHRHPGAASTCNQLGHEEWTWNPITKASYDSLMSREVGGEGCMCAICL